MVMGNGEKVYNTFMLALKDTIEEERTLHITGVTARHKADFGQFFTPYPIAEFMASLFPIYDGDEIDLLDPGAGIGSLSIAFLEHIQKAKWPFKKISINAYDLDPSVQELLIRNLEKATKGLSSRIMVSDKDFIEDFIGDIFWRINKTYTHIIMNPPYKKIHTNSLHRSLLHQIGLETVNLYTAFLATAILATRKHGYICAIIPRSFCNGVYYKPFRYFLLQKCAIKHIHLFETRNTAFVDESVLQENIIILLQRDAVQNDVAVSYSDRAEFINLKTEQVSFSRIIQYDDPEKYIHIPIPGSCSSPNLSLSKTLFSELQIMVSTGPVVDFRYKQDLCENFQTDSVPLLYPIHFRNFHINWPKKTKKPNAIVFNTVTEKLLYQTGYYVVVKRFSSKEEKKRIVASIIEPDAFTTNYLAFENHLNVFHISKKGLKKDFAYGLMVYLNTQYIDAQFRLFSGHTQVNVSDLKKLKYPSKREIVWLGQEIQKCSDWTQELFDVLFDEMEKNKCI